MSCLEGTDGGLTDDERAEAEELFPPALMRVLLARAREMRQDNQPGRLGIFASLNGRGEVTENETVTPPRRERRRRNGAAMIGPLEAR